MPTLINGLHNLLLAAAFFAPFLIICLYPIVGTLIVNKIKGKK